MAHWSGQDVLLVPELAYDEQYYLNRSGAEPGVRIRNSQGETVAYIDGKGEVRLRGHIFEHFTGWDLWQ